MATTQALPMPDKAFPKYPVLPTEIRLMIIDDAIQVFRQETLLSRAHLAWSLSNPLLFQLSSINKEWNKVIEMRLFSFIRITPSALADFDEICSKRPGRVNTIKLSMANADVPDDVEPQYVVGQVISRVLDIMKSWDPLYRERQGLIEVQLDVSRVWMPSSARFDVSGGFDWLPQVPVVGALYEVTDPSGEPKLHPWSSLRLYRLLPNVRRVGLNLRFIDDNDASVRRARNDIASLGIMEPSLTHLELLPDLPWCNRRHNWKLWIPAVACITIFPRSWHNSLVRLDLKKVEDVPGFLVEAGKVAWPNLKTLVLLGEVDSTNKSKQQLLDENRETCNDLALELTTILPNMPKMSTILIEMHDFSWNFKFSSFRFQMCLGNTVPDVKAAFGPACSFGSCSYKFVSNHDNGTLVVAGSCISGEVATQLQRTLRRHQGRDLGVFSHDHEPSTWGRGQCWQWDQEKSGWGAVFEDEGDELIYQIGQYFDSTVPAPVTTN